MFSIRTYMHTQVDGVVINGVVVSDANGLPLGSRDVSDKAAGPLHAVSKLASQLPRAGSSELVSAQQAANDEFAVCIETDKSVLLLSQKDGIVTTLATPADTV
jgi:hypothetical protein